MARQEPVQLNDSVYEFYRPDGEFNVEFVAFHGLRLSDYEDAYKTTWQVEDGTGCWLRDSIKAKFPRARILSISYDSCAEVSDEAGRMSFSNIGQVLVQDLIHLANVGQRGCPVVLIGYCLGGLVIKQLCTDAEKQYDQAPDGASKGRLDNFLTNVRAIVFLDAPHSGTRLGPYLSEIQCTGPVLHYLSNSSPFLGKLNSEFDSLAFEREWKRVYCWYCWNTLVWDSLKFTSSGLQVVEEESAGGQGRFYPINADHSGKAVHASGQLDIPLEYLQGLLKDIIQKTKLPHHTRTEHNSSPTFIVNGDRSETEKRLTDSLYEMYRRVAEKDVKLELMFFPGSLKDDAYKTTWMSHNKMHCWLQTWLPDAFPEARVLAVSYNENIDLTLICENLIQNIIRDKRSTRWCPLILVGHCFGGLVIKELCNQVQKALRLGKDVRDLQEFVRNVRGVAYYGTSHSGYSSDKQQMILSGGGNRQNFSGEMSDKAVGRLNTAYMRCVTSHGWKELALGETHPTKQGKTIIVDEFSASHGVQRNSFFPVAADHFSICKPKSPTSNSFQYLVHFIRTTMNEAQYTNMNVRRKKRRGVFIIIGMEKGRPGSEADRHRLEAMADYLKFDPFMVLDEPESQFPSVIENILKEKLEEEDECILCCVNAHGAVSDGISYILDNEGIRIDLRSAILKPIADCPRLAGKPKVFVVNCCRTISDERNTFTGLQQEPEDHSVQQEQNDLQGVDHCLLMYSTKLDTKAWRQEDGYEKGTLFVSEMAYHISVLYQTTDVEEILKTVGERVAELAERKKVEQFPVLYTSLRKRLSWRPR